MPYEYSKDPYAPGYVGPYGVSEETRRRQADENRRINNMLDDMARQRRSKEMERLIPNHMLK